MLALLALGWTAVSSATSSQAFDLSTGSACDGELPHRPDFFCAMFALAACYMVRGSPARRGWWLLTRGLACWQCCQSACAHAGASSAAAD